MARPSCDGGARSSARDVAPSSSFAVAPGYGVGGVIEALFGAPADAATPAPGSVEDAFWMRRALLAAMGAKGRASPNPTVGAVIVKDGALIATGATEHYGQRHAERCAIDNVADRAVLRGATIYTTLEPCAHWGRQPPCADLVASCGFARCVAGVRDPNPRVAGVGLERVRAAGAEVLSGVLRNEILAWHLPYLFPRVCARPLISAIAVEATNGDRASLLLGRSDGWDGWDTSRRYRGWLKQKCDAVITEPSAASIDPEAFARGAWRGVVWWDLDGTLARMPVAQARDLGARARDLGAPVVLCCVRRDDNAERIDACIEGGVFFVATPDGVDPATWLTSSLENGALAAVTGDLPTWVLIDDHPRLAEALAAHHAVDAVHAIHATSSAAPDAHAANGAAPGECRSDHAAARLSLIARHDAAGALISEYYTQRLSSAFDETTW